ncbi:hypothetical protein [Metabacillus arenae]|uniref:Uncharacterized protein n=1 Tax=Metabacillus arenae TaxID=2771434 RepID=A0A926N7Y9_9BACI|nr:hypothetical protein [Metabacillus arenae]MBD1379057.1 hypothetical protein [Metabacillus arenae]
MVDNNIQLDGNKFLNRINARINALQNLISMDIAEAPELNIKLKELMSVREELLSGEFNIQIW